MALRLTDSSSPAEVAAPALSAADRASRLTDRARNALLSAALDDFRAVAGDALALDDDHRRGVLRRRLVELGLEASRNAHGDRPQLLLATAEVAAELLEAEPSEPTLLNLSGVAFFELGSVPGADALLSAAARLDPAVPNLQENLAAVRDLRRRGRGLRPEPSVAAAVPALERRAKAIAAAARPAASATVALCMIVRDEEAVIAGALASARDVVDEIVVVDTGSTDRTAQIAREHGALVVGHPWSDDFAAARNVGLELVTSDWILVLDADERLADDDAPRLRDLVRQTWREGFELTIVNHLGDGRGGMALSQDVLRLFRNRPEHRFAGRIHESVLQCLPGDAPERVAPGGVRIDHRGYLTEVRAAKDKSRRNLELLVRELEAGEPTAYLRFNLGMELLAAGEAAAAADELGRAWDLLQAGAAPAQESFAPALVTRRVRALTAAGRPADAIAAADAGLALFCDLTDVVFEQALAHRDLGDDATAERLLRRCLELGDAPSRLSGVAGAGSFLASIELGRLLSARGDSAAAIDLLEPVVAEHPELDAARIALADALLAATRYADAAAAVAPVPDGSPWQAPAAARAALGRAAASGTPALLPADALDPLALALDARLLATDIDGFVGLLPLAGCVADLDPRARRELLAVLYLRHGFLDSAADEWAAACDEHGPDAAALTGLAQIAAARGDEEDARVFAEGARELAGQA